MHGIDRVRTARRSALACLLMLVAAAACESGPHATTGQTQAPASTPPIDLAAIVVSPDEPPLGMGHDAIIGGRDTLTLVVVSGRNAAFAALDGFVDGRATTFSGDAGALLSMVLVFEPSIHGDLAYHEYGKELNAATGYNFDGARVEGLGFENVCGTGTNPLLGGLVESICLWRAGGLVLAVGGPLPLADVQTIAEEMHARATVLADR